MKKIKSTPKYTTCGNVPFASTQPNLYKIKFKKNKTEKHVEGPRRVKYLHVDWFYISGVYREYKVAFSLVSVLTP